MRKGVYEHAEDMLAKLQHLSKGNLEGATICLSYGGYRIAMTVGDMSEDKTFFASAINKHKNEKLSTIRVTSVEDSRVRRGV